MRFLYQMMFVLFSSNMTDATGGAGTTYTSGAPQFIPKIFVGFVLLNISVCLFVIYF